MSLSRILTDDAAQFTKLNFPGSKNLIFLHSSIDKGSHQPERLDTLRPVDLPGRVAFNQPPSLVPLSFESLEEQILSLYQSVDDLFIILVSKELYPYYSMTESIISKLHGRATIHLLDSQSIAIGEGQIVQKAAELINQGVPGNLIEEQLREMVYHVYTLLSTPNLSYLHKAGFIDSGQASVGEMLGFYPIFALEDGKLNPLDKIKNFRGIVDYFIEFISEFEKLENISIIQPVNPNHNDTKLIHQHVQEFYPGTQYSEHMIHPFLASLIGPQGMGIVITEKFST
mgnify:CR=1 FL=1